MRKKELALEVIRRLKEEYPDADCTLDYDEAGSFLSVYVWQPSVQMRGSM